MQNWYFQTYSNFVFFLFSLLWVQKLMIYITLKDFTEILDMAKC